MHKKRKGDEAPEIELPITPMLDMTFQLLTFFIFTYHPSELEGQMELALPGAGQIKAKVPEDEKPSESDAEVDAQAKITVKVRTNRTNLTEPGGISLIEVESLGKSQAESVRDLKELKEYLIQVRGSSDKDSDPNDNSVKIEADTKLRWSCIVDVMDVCKQAGYGNVGFAPPPDRQ